MSVKLAPACTLSLFKSLFICLISASVFCQAAAISRLATTKQAFGVGFSLSIDYGISSIYFPNGTTVDVAKIEGGHEYKSLMRHAGTELVLPYTSNALNYLGETSKDELRDSAQAFLGKPPSTLRKLFNSSLTESSRHRGMISMFKALKTAVEMQMEQQIHVVDVTVPFPISDRLHESIEVAYNMNSLEFMRFAAPAGEVAARHQNLVGVCDHVSRRPPPQIILAVDYSHTALTLTAFDEQCGEMKAQRVMHSEGLGRDADAMCRTRKGDFVCDSLMREAVRATLGSFSPWNPLAREIVMVLVGELSADTRLLWNVRNVVDEEVEPDTAPGSSKAHAVTRDHPVNPVFAAARAAASAVWEGLGKPRNGVSTVGRRQQLL